MLEILYRIYEVATQEEAEINFKRDLALGMWSISKAVNNELLTDCLICDSREQFKKIIREEYGDNISFRYNKNLKAGDLYCIIIGEHCYDTERYFQKITFTCDNCGSQITSYIKKRICFSDYEIKSYFYNNAEYKQKSFCCYECKNHFQEKERKKINPNEDQEFYIRKDMFSEECAGYIYKITKKSTGEFYIGQTVYAPIFRWGQHLKTERFPIRNITDYQFEVIEIVPKGENLLEREKYYIQKYYIDNPEKSLNIACTTNLNGIL